jgi:hypothetical protein
MVCRAYFWGIALSIRRLLLAACATLAVSAAPALAAPHNVIIFVADGLRSQIVTQPDRPGPGPALRAEGVDFHQQPLALPEL